MTRPQKVLIVEDSLTFAIMLRDSIQQEHGYGVDVVSTLASARAMVMENPKRYFMAIVDLHLPDAPHGEAAFFIVDAGIPTLVFTGSDELSSDRLWKMGISDYVHKNTPFSVPYVVWAVKRFYANFDIGVLVVDDMLTVRQHVGRTLKVQNFKVYLAENTAEAKHILAHNADIRIAIIDHFMVAGDGITLTGELCEKHGIDSLEIIGMSETGLSTPFLKAGAIDFLHKPFSNEELLCRVNHSADRLDTYQNLKSLNTLKNRFLGMAAHDIRNPIGAIKAMAGMLNKPQITRERQEHIARRIENNCSEVLTLLENLLDISAIESGHTEINRQPCNLDTLIQQRVEMLQFHADDKHIQLRAHYGDAVELPIDKLKFAQVIDNLLSNAIKFSPTHSEIWIKTDTQDSSLRMQVIDAGPGLTAIDEASLFQPFCKLSARATQGEKQTGLGLSIAKSVVEAHGGDIFFKRTTEGKSRFVVHLRFATP